MKRKRIKNYTLLVLIGFLINFLFFSAIMIGDYLKLPSESWSKEIPIEDLTFPSGVYISNQYQLFDSMALEKGFLVSCVEEGTLKLQNLDNDFKILEESSLPFKTDSDIRSVNIFHSSKKEMKLGIYSIKNKTLSFYGFQPDTLKIDSNPDSIADIKYFTAFSDALFYIKDNALYQYGQNSTEPLVASMDTEILSNCEDDSYYYVFSVERVDSKRMLTLYKISKDDSQVEKIVLNQLPSDNAISLQNLEILKDDGQLAIVSVLRNSKTEFNLSTLSYYDLSNYHMTKSYDLSFSDYMPNPKLFKSDGNLKISYVSSYQLGRVDVSRKYSSYPNYAVGLISDGAINTVKQLTKTENSKIHPQYYERPDQNTLLWLQFNGDHYTLYGASNNPKHIAESRKFDFISVFGVVMNALTTYFPALYSSLVLLFSIIVPIVVLYGAVSFFKITWVEHHGDTILWIMLITHTLIKFYSFVPTIQMTLGLMQGLPFIYSTFWGEILYALALSVLSFVSFLLYFKEHHNKGSFVQYLRFAIIDCLLLITAFYPLYFV